MNTQTRTGILSLLLWVMLISCSKLLFLKSNISGVLHDLSSRVNHAWSEKVLFPYSEDSAVSPALCIPSISLRFEQTTMSTQQKKTIKTNNAVKNKARAQYSFLGCYI